MSPVDPALPLRHTATYRVRFDEATPRGLLRGSALLGYVQDVAWRHSEALGFSRDWYRAKGVAWLVRAVEARVLAPIPDGETVAVTTRLTGSRKVMARRETVVTGPDGEPRAVVLIDWAMSDERTHWRLTLSHSALSNSPGTHGAAAMATVRMDRPKLAALVGAGIAFAEALDKGLIVVDGDVRALQHLLGTLDVFNPMFNILEP
jgi:acyl-CoA thioesterase FadM